MRQSLFYFLAHGMRQLTRDVKSDVNTLNFRCDVTYVPPLKTSNDVVIYKTIFVINIIMYMYLQHSNVL